MTVDVFCTFTLALEKHCRVNVTDVLVATDFVSNRREPSLPCAINVLSAKSWHSWSVRIPTLDHETVTVLPRFTDCGCASNVATPAGTGAAPVVTPVPV